MLKTRRTRLFVWRSALAFAALVAFLAFPGHIRDMSATPTFDGVQVEPGRRLHAVCSGPQDKPLVLYDAGAFGIYADGWWVREALSDDFQVCLYDRAGMGWSDPVPVGATPSPDWHVEDMRRLARAIGAKPPWYIVGHSMSGVRMHAYANLYPDELAGLVFVDAAAPQAFDTQRVRRLIGLFKGAIQAGGLAARMGLARAVAPLIPDELDLPRDQKRDKRRAMSWVRHYKAAAAEIGAAELGAPYLKDHRAGTIPLAAFTNSAGGGGNRRYADAAEAATGYGRLTVRPEETHVSFLNREGAQRIATAIREMENLRLAAAPTGSAP
ncbi:MAG: alpha/beta hydrolase [Pseudomonadota bacterium]